ncbi:hypothetical protein [Phytohabitans rumicis]|uniref:hypothetical protein n=1 Tax=Phytohabitans rumicis TaxID=1076125 RepID=UPI001563EBD8|nr:hypothetical protein [Phytohabitans rumicis]
MAEANVRARQRLGWLVVAAVPVLFAAYLAISRGVGVNSDGASNAIQAWDMLHGNVLLSGWTVTDVSFYTNELLLFALVEAVYGYHADTTHAVAALVFTLLVLVVAAAAKGRATGREAVFRVAVAVAIVAVPALGFAAVTQLSSPDHTGTAIPLLLTWLVLERAKPGRWVPYAIAAMLAWGQIADPLVMYIGVLPLIAVGGFRALRGKEWRGLDARLVLAGLGSVLLAQATMYAIRLAGGFGAHAAEAMLSPVADLGKHLWLGARVLAVNFGAYPPDREGPAGVAMSLLHLVGLLAALAAMAVVVSRALRRRHSERLDELVAAGILVNVGAFVVSALPTDLLSARQVVAVLPLGAVLAGRVWGPRLASSQRTLVPAVVVLALLGAELAAHATAPSKPGHAVDVADWLESRGLRYGVGEYWNANNITVLTGGKVQVAPVVAGERIAAYRWESKADWYDAGAHDATFLVVDTRNPASRTEAVARAQFGPPVSRHAFDGAVVLVYDRDLLVGLPAYCVPEMAPSIEECPSHGFPLFG